MGQAAYLVLRSRASFSSFSRFVAAHRGVGTLVAARGAQDISGLEPGTVVRHTWISRWPSLEAARAGFDALDLSDLEQPEPPQVLLASAVPDEGFPAEMEFVPTHTNVTPVAAQPPTLMVIEGTGHDQEKMDRYRDIILPLMREQDAFYLCFELGGSVQVLSGEWDEAIFAISRWPMAHQPRSFWLGATYQDSAVPLRIDIGSFQVSVMEGERDVFGGE